MSVIIKVGNKIEQRHLSILIDPIVREMKHVSFWLLVWTIKISLVGYLLYFSACIKTWEWAVLYRFIIGIHFACFFIFSIMHLNCSDSVWYLVFIIFLCCIILSSGYTSYGNYILYIFNFQCNKQFTLIKRHIWHPKTM